MTTSSRNVKISGSEYRIDTACRPAAAKNSPLVSNSPVPRIGGPESDVPTSQSYRFTEGRGQSAHFESLPSSLFVVTRAS